jgi:hypothetical protein
VSASGLADGFTWPPPAQRICVGNVVDRELLAEYLLKASNVSWQAASKAEKDAQARYLALSVPQRLIADVELCPDPKKVKDNPCGDKDHADLTTAFDFVSSLLMGDVPGYSRATTNDPTEYFLNTDTVIACAANDTPKDEPKATAGNDYSGPSPWRFRGAPDALYLRRTADAFKAADKAQVSFSDDQVQNKRTKKLIGAVGYAFMPLDSNGAVLQIVPYLGINDNLTNVTGKATSYTANTRDAGTVISWQWPGPLIGPSFTNIISIRPDFLWNNRNESRLMSLNASYIPIVGNLLNAQIVSDQQVIAIRSIFDLRLDEGHFTDMGRATPGTLADYLRLGSRFGFDFTTMQGMPYPLDWSLTETFLHGFRGTPDDIRYFKSTLSLGLDQKKNFSLDLSYSNGRREDTGERERGWNLSFGAKY